VRTHDETWLRRFARRGYPEVEPLGAGMEGAVYRLDDKLVAKVWGLKGEAELARMGAFYDELAASGLGFATPRFFELWEVDGLHVTIEPQLTGTPLDSLCVPGQAPLSQAVSSMLDVLEGLRSAGDLASARALPVLGEERAMWGEEPTWPAALGGLLERRLSLLDDRLRARFPDFDLLEERVRARLAELPAGETVVLHGDLIPANVLVDDALRPLGILDFGFFTTVGDSAFDLAVTASVFDMYGPRARETEATIDRAAVERFGVDPERLALYRAAYALATANIYDPDGGDGHFRWCVEMVGRADVDAALGADAGAR
jgi:hypothetical protein